MLETLGIGVATAEGKFTIANEETSVKYLHWTPTKCDSNNSKVVGMLLYLLGHSLILLMLPTVPLNICSDQSLCTDMPSSELEPI